MARQVVTGEEENRCFYHISIPVYDDGDGNVTTKLLANTLRKEMEELQIIPPECCIYRVPPSIKMLNERAYTPQVVSIGPFHRKKKELKRMEEHKLRYMKEFLARTETSLEDFIKGVTQMEKRVRDYYAEKITLSIDEFVKILVVDSFFILEMMFVGTSHDPRHHSTYLAKHVLRFKTDLILLENQIPFFVLKNLYHLAFPDHPRKKFLEISITYLHDVVLIKEKTKLFDKVKDYLKTGPEIKHFLDLLRICQLPSASTRTQSNKAELISIPNAIKLHEAGIQLYKLDSSDCLLDIKYKRGKLKIPLLVVVEYSEIVLSNILILENFLYASDSYVRDFVFFMQMLVNSEKDADLLIERGIIEDHIGESSTIKELFNKVGREVMISRPSYYFHDVSKDLNRHCDVTLNKWKASFKRDYCSTPWMIASTTVAAILVILTLLSTIAAFLAL